MNETKQLVKLVLQQAYGTFRDGTIGDMQTNAVTDNIFEIFANQSSRINELEAEVTRLRNRIAEISQNMYE